MEFKSGDWLVRTEENIGFVKKYTNSMIDIEKLRKPFLAKEITEDKDRKNGLCIKKVDGKIIRTNGSMYRKATPEETEEERIRMIFKPI